MLGAIARVIVLMLFFVAGCTFMTPDNDENLASYSEGFVQLSGGKVDISDVEDINIYFKTQDGSTIGTCYRLANVIEIDPTFFYTASPKRKIELVFHELSHCACNRRHTEGKLEDKCPDSLMYKTYIEDECLKKHWDYYMKEIYNGCGE